MAKTEYVKNGHTRFHCAGVKLGLSYLGDFYKPFSACLGLRAKGHSFTLSELKSLRH